MHCSGTHAGKAKDDSSSSSTPNPQDTELLQALAPASATPAAVAATPHIIQPQPPEVELQATAAEMQWLLLCGRRHDALKVAVNGQLWGPALVIAFGYGEKKFHEVVAAMSQQGLTPGAPFRTLALLLAGQADKVPPPAPWLVVMPLM